MTKECYVCLGTGQSKHNNPQDKKSKQKPCSMCKGAGTLPDFQKDDWAICKNCDHAIFKINDIWKHAIGMLTSILCNAKTCNCGGDGFLIYGRDQRNKECGVCNVGKICNCSQAEPIPYVKLTS